MNLNGKGRAQINKEVLPAFTLLNMINNLLTKFAILFQLKNLLICLYPEVDLIVGCQVTHGKS